MCGMTHRSDVLHAIQLGVHALGFIFHPASKRAITVEQAEALMASLPPFVSLVAVVVNPNPDEVGHMLDTLPIDYLQFHGDESAEFCEQFKRPYIKALPAISLQDIMDKIALYPNASALLLDTPAGQTYGGSGQTFDWSYVPKSADPPLILAGGITPDNIAKALDSAQPYAIDICSGIEISPGIKDHHKMAALMNQVRGWNES